MASISIGKKDIYWSYIGNFFRLAANILLLPFMLHFLSDDDLGLWYVFAGISQFVVLLDFGFAPALSRNIAYIWCGAKELKKEDVCSNRQEETDYGAFNNILTTCKYIYLSLSAIAFVLLSSIGTYYILSLNCKSENVLFAWLLYGLGVILNLYYSYFTSFLRGVGAVAQNNIAGVISKIVQIVVSCLLLYNGWGIVGASIGYLVSGIAIRFYSMHAFYNYERIGESLKKVTCLITFRDYWKTFLIIWYNASKEGLITASNYLSTQANTLICSSVLGLATTGSYGITVQLATIISGMSNIPYTTYQSKMMEQILKGDIHNSLKLFSGSMFLFSFVYLAMSICTISCIPIIVYFKPTFSINYYMMAALFIFIFIDRFHHNFCSYISNFNKLPYTYPYIISSIISVVLSFLLTSLSNLGVWALIIVPTIVALSYNAWKWPFYVLRGNEISINQFIRIGIEALRELAGKVRKRNK